jgi:hypothetical protein
VQGPQLNDHAVRRIEPGDLEIGCIQQIEHNPGCAGRSLRNAHAVDEFIADLNRRKAAFRYPRAGVQNVDEEAIRIGAIGTEFKGAGSLDDDASGIGVRPRSDVRYLN